MKHLLIFLLSALLPCCLHGQDKERLPTLKLTKDFMVLGRGGQVGVWHDVHRQGDSLSLEAMLPLFHPSKKERFHFGFTRHPHWFRVELTDTIDRELLLEMDNPNLSEVRFFLVTNQEADTSFVAGSAFSYIDSLRPSRNFLFPVSISAGDTVECYLHIPYCRPTLDFKLFLWDKAARKKWAERESLVLTAFFCALFFYLLLLGMAIYLTRLRYFRFYFLYVLLSGAFIYADIGAGFRNFWENYPYFQQVALLLLTNAYLIAGILFVRAHFRTKKDYPLLGFTLKALAWSSAGIMALSLLIPVVKVPLAHLIFYGNSVQYVVVSGMFFLLGGVALSRRDRAFPGWLLVGFLVHGLHIIYSNLEAFSMVPPLSLTSALAEHGVLFTFHTPLVLMASLLLEMGIVLFIGLRYFQRLDTDARHRLRDLARQKQENLTALGMGMELEQRRMAQELHDGLGSGLSAFKLKLEQLQLAVNDKDELPRTIHLLSGDLVQLHQELRDITRNLMPKPLYELGLIPAVGQLIRQMNAVAPQMQIHFHNHAALHGINELAKVFLFRIIQELLNNLLKHSQATEAWLSFAYYEGKLLLTLEDNGQGFDPEAAKMNGGIGLSNLRYRVEDALHGSFQIDSKIGQGTLISIEIPEKSLQ